MFSPKMDEYNTIMVNKSCQRSMMDTQLRQFKKLMILIKIERRGKD